MSDDRRKTGAAAAREPGPARLYALLAGAGLALLGVFGFFYDAGFGTGTNLADDDLAGVLVVNGWRNVVYLATGLLALALASRRPRATALALGLFYTALAIWGFEVTNRGIGSILDTLPLGDNDNALHLVLGLLGLGAALADGPLPSIPRSRTGSVPRLRSIPRSRLGPGRRGGSAAGRREGNPSGGRGPRPEHADASSSNRSP